MHQKIAADFTEFSESMQSNKTKVTEKESLVTEKKVDNKGE